MIWKVQLQGQSRDLEYLAHHFNKSPIIVSLDERDGSYLLQSDRFAALTDSEEVLNAAEEQLCTLNGVLKFMQQSTTPLSSGAVYRVHSNGRRDIFVHIRESIQFVVDCFDAIVTVSDDNEFVREPPMPRSVSLMKLALSTPSVNKALRLLNDDTLSWVELYRIYEVVEADLGGMQNLLGQGWVSSRQIERFKRSANSVAVAGDEARHGKELTAPPPKPFVIDEAKVFIMELLNLWFESKGA